MNKTLLALMHLAETSASSQHGQCKSKKNWHRVPSIHIFNIHSSSPLQTGQYILRQTRANSLGLKPFYTAHVSSLSRHAKIMMTINNEITVRKSDITKEHQLSWQAKLVSFQVLYSDMLLPLGSFIICCHHRI
jgi:hypothetical protein